MILGLGRYFGDVIEDREMDFNTALSRIHELEQGGALPVEFRHKQIKLAARVTKNPDYGDIYQCLRTFLAPYQYDFNPKLRGETGVRYIARDFPYKQTHKFYFDQKIDNLFGKGLSGDKGRLKLRLEK